MTKMKHIKIFFLLFIFSIAIFSCRDYSPSAPDACVMVEKMVEDQLVETSTFKVGEEVIISSCGSADSYAIWTGDPGADYSKKDERGVDKDGNTSWTNTGTNLSIKQGAQVVKVYSTPGSYTITLVATNSSTGSTDVEFIVAIDQKTITITN